MNRKLQFKPFLMIVFMAILLGSFACEAGGNLTGGDVQNPPEAEQLPEGEQPPDQPEITEPPPQPEPTQPPPQPELTQPPLPQPTPPPESSDEIIKWLLIILGGAIVLGALVFVVSLLARPKEKMAVPVTAPPPIQEPPASEPITENTHLKNANPEVSALYHRFVELVKSYGPVSIVPTQTRIDFQGRVIFASVQFRLDNLEIQLMLPRIVQDARIIRVETYGADKYAHFLTIDNLDGYDAQFNTWLQESYQFGSQSM